MGDAAGIGPEIISKTLAMDEIYDISRPIVIGDSDAIKIGMEVAGIELEFNKIKKISEAIFQCGFIDLIDLENIDAKKLKMGIPQAMAGKASIEYVLKATELVMSKNVEAIVTAPISKEAIKLGGYNYSGHTELLAELSGTRDFAMMLIAGNLRVVHVTTHVALSEVPKLIKRDRILRTIKLAYNAARSLGFVKPRIGVAGLNPHCGDGGLFGGEEIDEIQPAIEMARAMEIDVVGPVPPDIVFGRARGGFYDIVVAMYHDQGHIPVKLEGFKWDEKQRKWSIISGINTTIGLPFIRTSVDHGTAYGKAGRMEGTANPQSLIEAIKVAVQMSGSERVLNTGE